jgi:phospholipase C
VLNLYSGETATSVLLPGHVFRQSYPLKASFGWYDLVVSIASDPMFRQQLAGHLETGDASRTDPGMSGK